MDTTTKQMLPPTDALALVCAAVADAINRRGVTPDGLPNEVRWYGRPGRTSEYGTLHPHYSSHIDVMTQGVGTVTHLEPWTPAVTA